ncbi:Uncharacterized protein Fot_52724 [Forsythia ovata]|uniref:Uncharacterized protein n=1 Tax=Forsythia ovata TaxID=205694 RepID=A0ABD1PN33_9LAMI
MTPLLLRRREFSLGLNGRVILTAAGNKTMPNFSTAEFILHCRVTATIRISFCFNNYLFQDTYNESRHSPEVEDMNAQRLPLEIIVLSPPSQKSSRKSKVPNRHSPEVERIDGHWCTTTHQHFSSNHSPLQVLQL